MLRHIFPGLSLLLSAINCGAQDLQRYVIGSAGAYLKQDPISLSVCLGQSGLTGRVGNEAGILTIGFLQGEIVPVTPIHAYLNDLSIQIYPNPFHDHLTLDIAGGQFLELNFQLYNAIGRTILQKVYPVSDRSELRISVPDLTDGIYHVRLTLLDRLGTLIPFEEVLMCIHKM